VTFTLTFESVEFRDASLPGYGLGSRGMELKSPELAIGRKIEKKWQAMN
jgi:hypothetical protein